MEGKYYELQLELREVTGAPEGPVSCRVNVGGIEDILEGRSPLSLILDDVSSNTMLSLVLEQGSEVIGGFKFSLLTLFGESLSGKVEKWIRLKEETGKDVRIKLAANLQTAKMDTQPSQPDESYARRPREVEAKCPYVDHLASGKKRNEEPLEEIWKERVYNYDPLGNNVIRITLEPDGRFNQNLEPVPVNLNNLEELELASLEEAGGIQLKKIIKELSEKIKKPRTQAQQLPYLRNTLQVKIGERRDLQQSLEESANDLNKQAEDRVENIQDLLKKRQEMAEKLLEKQKKSREIEQEIDGIKAEVQQANRDFLRIQAFNKRKNDVEELAGKIHELLKDSLAKETELEKTINDEKAKMDEKKKLIEQNRDKLADENKTIQAQISVVSEKYKNSSALNEELKDRVRTLKLQYGEGQNYKQVITEARTASSLDANKREHGQEALKELVNLIDTQSSEFIQKQKSLIASKKSQTQNILEIDQDLNTKDQQTLELKRKLYLASNNQITLEQICCIKADLSQLIDELSKLHKIHSEGRDHILRDLDSGSEFVLKEAEKILEEARNIDPMIDAIDEKDFELDNLKGIVGEIKARNPPYMPNKDDPLDIALGEYLNSRDRDLPIPFTREDEGIYLFGTKRVFLKLENGDIKIRVGGGYTTIDEFIEIYTEIELENQEQTLQESLPKLSQSLSRFSQNPSVGMSPQRAARIISNTVEAIAEGSPLKKSTPHRRVPSGKFK
ncbi:unnamed protein product [Blepharisma stoltei]|uniref:GAR domain-containing protein n=1 Tax=Blepharisma stoltei TaxID=1481888 RepID=A0AAU9J2K7_9CILI|nr:unnamed protein product [Blepharisma stoltei]